VARRLLAQALPPRASPSDIAPGAAVAALLFAVHPLRVESVAWITERRDVVSGLFFMLALLSWLKYVDAPRAVRLRWYAASLGFFGCALLSKAPAVGLPVVLVVLDVYPLRRLGGTPRDGPHRDVVKEVWLEKIPYVFMAMMAAGFARRAPPPPPPPPKPPLARPRSWRRALRGASRGGRGPPPSARAPARAGYADSR